MPSLIRLGWLSTWLCRMDYQGKQSPTLSLSSQGEVNAESPRFCVCSCPSEPNIHQRHGGVVFALYQYGTPITQRVADALLHNHRIQYTRPGMLAWYKIMPPTNDPFNLKKSPVTDFFHHLLQPGRFNKYDRFAGHPQCIFWATQC